MSALGLDALSNNPYHVNNTSYNNMRLVEPLPRVSGVVNDASFRASSVPSNGSILGRLGVYGLSAFALKEGADAMINYGQASYRELAQSHPEYFNVGSELYEYGMAYQKAQREKTSSRTSLPTNDGTSSSYSPIDDGYKPTSGVSPESGDTLISVLKSSSNASHNLVNAVLLSNSYIAEEISSLKEQIRMISDVDIAYKDLFLGNYTGIQSSIESIEQSMKNSSEVDIAYRDANLEYMNDIVDSINGVSINSSPVVNVASAVPDVVVNIPEEMKVDINRSDDEITLIGKQLEHINFETTPIQMYNLGDTIPKVTPQKMRALKDAVVAKKNSDENTFELDENDIDDFFGVDIPDISSIFNFSSKTSRLKEVSDNL